MPTYRFEGKTVVVPEGTSFEEVEAYFRGAEPVTDADLEFERRQQRLPVTDEDLEFERRLQAPYHPLAPISPESPISQFGEGAMRGAAALPVGLANIESMARQYVQDKLTGLLPEDLAIRATEGLTESREPERAVLEKLREFVRPREGAGIAESLGRAVPSIAATAPIAAATGGASIPLTLGVQALTSGGLSAAEQAAEHGDVDPTQTAVAALLGAGTAGAGAAASRFIGRFAPQRALSRLVGLAKPRTAGKERELEETFKPLLEEGRPRVPIGTTRGMADQAKDISGRFGAAVREAYRQVPEVDLKPVYERLRGMATEAEKSVNPAFSRQLLKRAQELEDRATPDVAKELYAMADSFEAGIRGSKSPSAVRKLVDDLRREADALPRTVPGESALDIRIEQGKRASGLYDVTKETQSAPTRSLESLKTDLTVAMKEAAERHGIPAAEADRMSSAWIEMSKALDKAAGEAEHMGWLKTYVLPRMAAMAVLGAAGAGASYAGGGGLTSSAALGLGGVGAAIFMGTPFWRSLSSRQWATLGRMAKAGDDAGAAQYLGMLASRFSRTQRKEEPQQEMDRLMQNELQRRR